ncbi:hypothetical protein, partial [Thermococcus sp.]|uniref:hypothetical protein n=1 Tax=Thermococcus sp. TaxID=35749 RepID=UPI0026039590
MAILVVKNGQQVTRVEESKFENEAYLQNYIAENPELIPLEEIHSENRNFIVTIREFGTSSGSIDIMAIDNVGDIYIIETKLSKNADKRKVLAQILDYAAALWEEYSGNPDKFLEALGADIDEEVLSNITRNLGEGNFKLIVAMDSLDSRLKTLIRFLKSHATFDVYALEFDYYKIIDDNKTYEIFVPKLFGIESTEKKLETTRRKWTVESFMNYVETELHAQVPERAEAIKAVYQHALGKGWNIRAGQSRGGSINLVPPNPLISDGRSILTVYAEYGTIQVSFGWINDNEIGNAVADIIAEKLKNAGLKLRPDYRKGHIGIPEELWVPNPGIVLE